MGGGIGAEASLGGGRSRSDKGGLFCSTGGAGGCDGGCGGGGCGDGGCGVGGCACIFGSGGGPSPSSAMSDMYWRKYYGTSETHIKQIETMKHALKGFEYSFVVQFIFGNLCTRS